jgi:hypothetical protein
MDHGVKAGWYNFDCTRYCTVGKQECSEMAGFAASEALDIVVESGEAQEQDMYPEGLLRISIRKQHDDAHSTFSSSKVKARGHCRNTLLLHLSGDHVSVLMKVEVAHGLRI